MGPFAALFAIFKHFSPRWFPAIAKEADHSPATIAGLFFVWLTIIAMCISAWMMFQGHAEAAELRDSTLTKVVTDMQVTLAANTKALDCSRQDRTIGAKTREIGLTTRLLERAADDAERRDLRDDIAALERKLKQLETTYQSECLA